MGHSQQINLELCRSHKVYNISDSLHSECNTLQIEEDMIVDESVYQNIWNSFQIKYPSTILANEQDALVIRLIGKYYNPFYAELG